MIKVYRLRDKYGHTIQAAKTPFGLLLYPDDGDIKMSLSFGYSFLHQLSLKGMTFKSWKGNRYKVIGVKMMEYSNAK